VGKQNSKRGFRVYVLTPSFPPTDGGQEKHLLELSESLVAAGATLQVITRRVDRDFAPVERLGSVPVLRLRPFGEIKGVGIRAVPRLGFLLCKMLWRLVMDARNYDIVLVSGFNFMPISAILAALLTRKPCVVRPESPLEITEAVGAQSRAKMGLGDDSIMLRTLRSLRRTAARRVDRYVAISSEIGMGLKRAGVDAGRIVAIPNGISVGRFTAVTADRKAQLRAALGLPPDALLMIYTGRLAVSKGIMTLIEVWQELAAANPETHLVIVGTGRGSFDDCEPALREFILRHDLAGRVTLTGSVANVNEYLQASDLFVFPSDYEGFSLSILEAMCVGLPMVATRVGIAAELEGRGSFGLLVPPKDKAAFREALRRLLPDPARRAQMSIDAQAAVRAGYSSEAEARRYLELFAELTEAR
jgi:glycosyltransferase involved in cell wall biosynthesis